MFNPQIEIIDAVKLAGDRRLTVCQTCSHFQEDGTCSISGNNMLKQVYQPNAECPENLW